MATDIDILQIQINSESQKANKALDELISQIDKLVSSLSGVSKNSFTGVTTGLNNLNHSLKDINSVNVDKLTNIANAVKKISAIDATGLSSTAKSIKDLSGGLKEIGRVHVDTSNIVEISNAMSILGRKNSIEGTANLSKSKNDIIEFVTGLNNIGTLHFDFTGISNLVENLQKLGGKSVTQATLNLKPLKEQILRFISGLNGIGNLKFDTSSLVELTTALSKLGGKSVTNAIANIPQLAVAMKQLMRELSTAPRVSQNLIDMTNALAKLARTGASSGRAASSLVSSFQNIGKSSIFALSGIKKINVSLKSLIKTITPYVGIWQLFSLSKQAVQISSDLTEVQNVVDVTFGDFKQKIEDLADTSISTLGMSELTVKEISSRFQAMGTAMGFPTEKMSDMSVELTRLTGDMASFYNVSQKDIGKALQSIFTGETEPMRRYGIDLTNATLQQWALNNGISVSVNKMTQMQKATLRYQYVLANTGAAQGDFLRTQYSWSNQISILKQQLQELASIIGGSLVNAFKPLVVAMNSAMSYVIAFAQTVSNALGSIFGWKYEIGGGITNDLETGAGAADDIASGLGGAANNAKKLKSHLLSIDELNVVEPDDNSTSGGSGGGLDGLGNLDTNYGQWKQTESLLESYKSDIESLYELGKYIGDALINAMNSIDWDSVYEKARNFGTGLAEFLNGLISPELFGAVGRTIASSLNTAIYTALSFGTEFDWKNLGLSIATGINEFFATFDFASFAETINVWVQGIWETIWTAIKNIKWHKVFSGLLDFLDEIDLSTIFLLAIPNIKKILTLSTKLSDNFKKLTKNGKMLIEAFKGNETAIIALTERFPNLWKAIDVLRTSFQYLMFGINSGNWTGGIISAIENIRNNLTLLQKGVIASVAGFAEFKIVSNSFESIAMGTENLISEIAKISVAVGAAGAAMTLVFGFPAGIIATGIIGIIGAISGISDGIESLQLNSVFESIKTEGTISLETLGNVAKASFANITKGIDETTEKLNSISQTREGIDGTIESIGNIKNAIDVGAYSASEKIPEIISQFQSLLSQSKELFNEEYEVIVGNIVGAQADILEAQGQSIPLLVANLAKLRDEGNAVYSDLESSMASLVEQFNNGTISETEFLKQFTPLYEKFKGVNSDGSIDTATNAIQNMGSALDMSKYITEDNTFAVDKFRNDVNSVVQTAVEGKNGLQTLSEEQKANIDSMRQKLEALGVDASNFDWDMLYGASEEQVKQTKESIESAYNDYANQVQYSLLEQLPAIVENATADYENLKWWQKLFTTKEDYVQGEVNQWKDNVLTPATDSLQTGFEELGMESETWAGTAADKMIGSLFDNVVVYSNGIIEPTTNKLKSDWKKILENGLSGAAKAIDAESYGKDTVDGYNKGVKDNSKSTDDAILEWMNSIPTTIHDSDMEFGSPSVTAWNFGKDTVDGYNLGIAENTESSIQTVTEWATSILQAMHSALGIGEGAENNPSSMFGGIITNFNYTWESFSEIWAKNFSSWKKENDELYFGEKVWLKNWMNLHNTYKKVWKEFFELWKENFSFWWDNFIVPYFSVEQWTKFGKNMKNGIYGGFKSIVGDITRVLNAIIVVFDSAFSRLESSMNKLIRDYNKAAAEMGTPKLSTVNYVKMGKIEIPAFSTGGVVEDGLFYMNHNEIIGKFSNGKTTVENNSQIVDSIENGVERAVARVLSPYLAEIAQNTRETADKDFDVNLDSRSLLDGLKQRSIRNGYSFT